jgi:hypothetical protein
MPSWKDLVGERLDISGVAPEQQAEIIAELAAHLEDLCAEHRRNGLSEPAAIECALIELNHPRRLSKNIQRSRREEETMSSRTKRLLLPGLASMAIAIVAPVLLLWIGAWVGFHSFDAVAHPLFIKFDFLLANLFAGAAGAHLCRRAGGSRRSRIAAALFPAVAWLCCVCVVFVSIVGFIEPGHFVTGAGAVQVMSLTVFQPAGLLLLGALPFLFFGDAKKPAIAS